MDNISTVREWHELGIFDTIRHGVQTRVRCPSCADTRKPEHQKEKEFVISEDGEKGYCHHCGFRANILTYTGDKVTTNSMPVSSHAAPEAFKPPALGLTPSVASWDAWEPVLKERGLDISVLANDFNCAFIERSDIGYTVAIPQYDPDTGELVNHKYRGIDKEFRNDPGTYHPLYNLDKVKGADTIVIVEGEFDVFAIEAAGFPHVVSVPDGAPNPGTKDLSKALAYLERSIPHLSGADRIILALDNDEPGDMLRKELENRLGVGTVAHIRFPDGVKDANDALLKLGAPWLQRQIANARAAPASGVFTPRSMLGEMRHALRYGFDTGTRIGFPDLDRIYRPTAGHLTIVTGHAGSGKSTIIDNIVVRLSVVQRWPICYFSPEQMPLERHLFNLAEIWIDKPVVPARAKLFNREPATEQEVMGFIDLIDPYISHISPEMADDNPSLERILELATAEVHRNGIKGLVLDPWNEIEVARPTNVTETEWVSIALGNIRRWARKHSVHVWLIAHPRKMRSDEGVDAVPGLGDISGSNNFRNKADYGLTIYGDRTRELLPGQNSSVTVRVTKSRWRDSAIVNGEASFLYNPATNRIENIQHQYSSEAASNAYGQGSLY